MNSQVVAGSTLWGRRSLPVACERMRRLVAGGRRVETRLPLCVACVRCKPTSGASRAMGLGRAGVGGRGRYYLLGWALSDRADRYQPRRRRGQGQSCRAVVRAHGRGSCYLLAWMPCWQIGGVKSSRQDLFGSRRNTDQISIHRCAFYKFKDLNDIHCLVQRLSAYFALSMMLSSND